MGALRRKIVILFCICVAVSGAIAGEWQHITFTTAGPEPDDSLPGDMLTAHNDIRARMGVAPLEWSDRLAVQAQDWANHLLRQEQFYHRPHQRYGENLFEIMSHRGASAADVVNVWADEARDYDYSGNRCRGMCGHYTQIIWAGTREVGCAVAREPLHEVWVCNYNPPGNWVGERPY